MGKKRSRQKKPPVPPTTAGQVVDSNTPEPMGNVETDRAIASLWTRFWDRPFHPLQLLVFRFCFFALVAFESFRDLEHAPRYGAGGFNVPHFPILELLPTPSRYGMVVLYLAQCALSLRVAFGLGGRVTVWALTAVYGYTYFISQLDSYQHHYMVFLFLFLTCLVDWESDKPRTWPIQLVVVQTGIVYMWAGVTKLHPLWTEGTLLRRQAGGGEFGALVKSWCDSLGVSLDQAWWFMANWSMAAEFVVPLLFLSLPMIPEGRGRLRDGLLWLTCALGLGLHVGIEMAQLKIGLFSYMMMSFYLLVMPVSAWRAISGMWGGTLPALGDGEGGRRGWALLGLAVLFTGWTIARMPLEYVGIAALVVSTIALASEWPLRSGRTYRAIGHALVGLTLLYAASTGTTMRQYWYYLGGDARRRGDVSLAIYGYDQTTRVEPTYPSGWKRLGQMYQRTSRPSDARSAYERGLQAAGPDFDLYEQLAVLCERERDHACAGNAAREALRIKTDPRLKAIADRNP